MLLNGMPNRTECHMIICDQAIWSVGVTPGMDDDRTAKTTIILPIGLRVV